MLFSYVAASVLFCFFSTVRAVYASYEEVELLVKCITYGDVIYDYRTEDQNLFISPHANRAKDLRGEDELMYACSIIYGINLSVVITDNEPDSYYTVPAKVLTGESVADIHAAGIDLYTQRDYVDDTTLLEMLPLTS